MTLVTKYYLVFSSKLANEETRNKKSVAITTVHVKFVRFLFVPAVHILILELDLKKITEFVYTILSLCGLFLW